MRLDKLLMLEGYGSKKKVKRLIRSKKVTINGTITIHENQNVDTTIQHIFVNNKKIERPSHVYFMLNKPSGVVTAVKDKQHQTVIDLLSREDFKEQIFPVGRLDRDTEGLLLLTDNGQLGYQLLLPNKKVVKQYQVLVNEYLTELDCKRFAEGIIFLDGQRCQPAKLQILSAQEKESWAILDIEEGKFHQVKKMFLAVGKKVMYLKRLAMGPLQLDPQLSVGEYRSLTNEELNRFLPYFIAHEKTIIKE